MLEELIFSQPLLQRSVSLNFFISFFYKFFGSLLGESVVDLNT